MRPRSRSEARRATRSPLARRSWACGGAWPGDRRPPSTSREPRFSSQSTRARSCSCGDSNRTPVEPGSSNSAVSGGRARGYARGPYLFCRGALVDGDVGQGGTEARTQNAPAGVAAERAGSPTCAGEPEVGTSGDVAFSVVALEAEQRLSEHLRVALPARSRKVRAYGVASSCLSELTIPADPIA